MGRRPGIGARPAPLFIPRAPLLGFLLLLSLQRAYASPAGDGDGDDEPPPCIVIGQNGGQANGPRSRQPSPTCPREPPSGLARNAASECASGATSSVPPRSHRSSLSVASERYPASSRSSQDTPWYLRARPSFLRHSAPLQSHRDERQRQEAQPDLSHQPCGQHDGSGEGGAPKQRAPPLLRKAFLSLEIVAGFILGMKEGIANAFIYKWLEGLGYSDSSELIDDRAPQTVTSDEWEDLRDNLLPEGKVDPEGPSTVFDETFMDKSGGIAHIKEQPWMDDSHLVEFPELLEKDSVWHDSSNDMSRSTSVSSAELEPKISEDGVFRHWCRTLVIGGGVAAGYLARRMVHEGLGWNHMCIVTAEKYVPYERSELIHRILPTNPLEYVPAPGLLCSLAVKGGLQYDFWYTNYGIPMFMHMNVSEVKLKENVVVADGLDDGKTRLIKYNSLVIATGARAKTLEDVGVDSGGFENIFYIRDADDLARLREAIQFYQYQLGEETRACVVGGGYIGVETASHLYTWGLNTTIVHSGANLLNTFIADRVGSRYTNLFRRYNVTLKLNVTAFGVLGGVNATGIMLSDGNRVPCDFIVSAVGAKPRSELFADQLNITKDGAIATDSTLNVGVPGVYAIGDVAAFPSEMQNSTVWFPHVEHARQSAEYIGSLLTRISQDSEKLLNEFIRESEGPSSNISAYNFIPRIVIRSKLGPRRRSRYGQIGAVQPSHGELFGHQIGELVYFNCRTRFKFGAFWIHQGKVVGSFIEGGLPRDIRLMRKTVERQTPVLPVEIDYMSKSGLDWAQDAFERLSAEIRRKTKVPVLDRKAALSLSQFDISGDPGAHVDANGTRIDSREKIRQKLERWKKFGEAV